MLKHVLTPSSSLPSYRFNSGRDNLSVASLGSSGAQDPLSSRSSSSSSLHDPSLQPQKIPVKIFAKVLCPDIEYKTLSIDYHTTSKEVVIMLLSKFKMIYRDPNLFYLTMEVQMRRAGTLTVPTVVVLDDEACPAKLKTCQPHNEPKFCLKMRRGGLVKVYDSCLMAASQYKSLLISERTTAEELIQLLLHCYNLKESPLRYSLYEVCLMKKYEHRLYSQDRPLLIQQNWPLPGQYAFHLRKNFIYTPKQRTVQQETLEHKPCQRTSPRRGQIVPQSSHSLAADSTFNEYENYFYI